MRVAAVQTAARGLDESAAALSDALAGVAAAAARGADLVVLPECTWPGYVIGSDWRERWPALPASQEEVLDRLGAAAAAAGVVLVAGLALTDGEGLRNVAVVWERDGSVSGTVAKRFLWDFDARWFTPGTDSPVIATSVGRLGVLVCADGRMPEVARQLAVGGAEVLLDPTAWVTAGADPGTWTNPQYAFLLPARARENGLWTVAANKVGLERDAVAYCGRSCVLDPAGRHVVSAAPDRPDVALADIDPAPARLPVQRRPGLYRRLGDPAPPAGALVEEALVPGRAVGRVAVDALDRPLTAADLAFLADAGTALLVSPRPVGTAAGNLVLARTSPDRAELRRGSEVLATWQRTHGPGAPGSAIGPVVATPLGGLGVLLGADGLLPEACRVLLLEGADIVVWLADDPAEAGMAAARAAENRVNLVLAAPGSARILDPDGAVLAATGERPRLIAAVVSLSAARQKQMAPGTDVVRGRQPGCYASLTATEETLPASPSTSSSA